MQIENTSNEFTVFISHTKNQLEKTLLNDFGVENFINDVGARFEERFGKNLKIVRIEHGGRKGSDDIETNHQTPPCLLAVIENGIGYKNSQNDEIDNFISLLANQGVRYENLIAVISMSPEILEFDSKIQSFQFWDNTTFSSGNRETNYLNSLDSLCDWIDEAWRYSESFIDKKRSPSGSIDRLIAQSNVSIPIDQSVRTLLKVALSLMPERGQELPIISKTALAVAAIEWARSANLPHVPYPFSALARSLKHTDKDYKAAINNQFPASITLKILTYEQIQGLDKFQLSKSVKNIFRLAQAAIPESDDSQSLTATHVIQALLHHTKETKSWLGEQLEALGLSLDELIHSFERAINEQEEPSDPPVWLCRYNTADSQNETFETGNLITRSIKPFAAKTLEGTLQREDPVIFWRGRNQPKSEDSSSSQRGIFGWGSVKLQDDDLANERVTIRIDTSQTNDRLSKKAVFERLGLEQEAQWPGSGGLKRLTKAEASALLPLRPPPDNPLSSKTGVVADRAEKTRDLLGRADIAFSLAAQINRIWSAQNPKNQNQIERDQAAFVMHIDAPWGGGKTTFANFLTHILNPEDNGIDLKKLDQRQNDNTIEPGSELSLFANLRLTSDDYWPEEFRNRRWISVFFNAWQHQHVKPPWWNLYEAILKQCQNSMGLMKPVAWTKEVLWRFWTPDFRRTLFALFVVALSVALLWKYGWFKPPTEGSNDLLNDFIPLLLAGGGIWAIFGAFQSGVRKIVDDVSQSSDAASLGQADPLNRFRKHFDRTMRSYSRPVMVIIDDLDRCEPEFVVEMVRGILTVFRSPRVMFLLLGDKAWIETAFAKYHEEMANVNQEDHVPFGARFAEKTIQLSFILPEPADDHRDTFITHLLGGKPAQTRPAAHTSNNEENGATHSTRPEENVEAINQVVQSQITAEAERTRDLLKEAKTAEQRDEIVHEALTQAKRHHGEDTAASEQVQRAIFREAILKSATIGDSEDQIKHALLDIKHLLPGNPRRIKRIINMIAVYQDSAQLTFRIRLNSTRWKTLVIWVLIMAEDPETWRVLCSYPDLADALSSGNDLQKALVGGQSARLSPDERAAIISTIKCGMLNPIKDGVEFGKDNIKLTSEEIAWLRRLTPIN